MINEYTQEKTCVYKNESYLVRDNGSICRLPKAGKKIRPLDNKWTFGTKDQANGYMIFCGERVHRIVATAFWGEHSQEYVVDHIDTNRCNNRIENLRWLTKLENVLQNPITVKKIISICGSIEAFLEDPSSIGNAFSTKQHLSWMRTVSAEEGKATLDRLTAWAEKDTNFSSGKTSGIGEWIFKNFTRSDEVEDEVDVIDQEYPIQNNNQKSQNILDLALFGPDYNAKKEEKDHELSEWEKRSLFAQDKNESLTTGALQKGFGEKMAFPLCPEVEWFTSFCDYASNLEDGKVFAKSESGSEYIIESVGWTCEWNAIQVEVKQIGGSRYDKFYVHISLEDGVFVHTNGEYKSIFRFCDSSNVLQCEAQTKNSFPSCPIEGNISLEEYANILQKGVLVQKNQYTKGLVFDREIAKSEDGSPILYVGVEMPDSNKPYGDMIVFIENGKVIHQIGNTYFDPRFLERKFCKMRGQEWIEDPNDPIMDDYC